jgi:hypothetical protein
MAKAFLDDLHAFICIGIDCMGLGVNQGTKLNDELLKSIKVKLLGLSLLD